MHVVNHTHYRTSDLRAILGTALRAGERADGPVDRPLRNWLVVECVHGPQMTAGTYTFLHGTYMRIKLPKAPPSVSFVTYLFLHELDHVRGLKHRQMDETAHRCLGQQVARRHPELAFRLKPAVARQKAERLLRFGPRKKPVHVHRVPRIRPQFVTFIGRMGKEIPMELKKGVYVPIETPSAA